MFTSWSPDGEIVLECAHEVKDAAEKKQSADVTHSLANMVVLKPDDIKNKMVFPMSQVVTFGCVDVDPEYALKEGTYIHTYFIWLHLVILNIVILYNFIYRLYDFIYRF